MPNADAVMNMQSAEDPGDAEGATPEDGTGYPEFGSDLGVELPSLEFELSDYVTIIMD